MSRKAPHCSLCAYFYDRGFGVYIRRLCLHPEYRVPYRTGFPKCIPSDCAVTSPLWCPLRGGAK